MHDSMLNKLDQLKNRIAEIETLLVDSETVATFFKTAAGVGSFFVVLVVFDFVVFFFVLVAM